MTAVLTLPGRNRPLPGNVTEVDSNSDIDRGAFNAVLQWVKEIANKPLLATDIPGVTDIEAFHLARLSALVKVELESLSKHPKLVSALTTPKKIQIPHTIRESFRKLLQNDPTSHLAAMYASVVKAENRRRLGTFFTPREEAISMVKEFSKSFTKPNQVVDIGAGVGVFSEAANSEWPGASIYAVDVNPVTLGLQAVSLSARGERDISLVLDDFANWLDTFDPSGPTLYLGNPPYTRWQLIPDELRDGLIEAVSGLVGASANLSTLFLAMTLKKLRPEDSLCLIVPAGWMSAKYARHLRAYVRKQKFRRVTLRLADSWRFDGAIVDAVVVEIGPTMSEIQPLRVMDWIGKRVIQVEREDEPEGPFPRLATNQRETLLTENSISMKDVARVRRGLATGANDFFVVNESKASQIGIPSERLRAMARRLRSGDSDKAPLVEKSFLIVLGDYIKGANKKIDAAIMQAEKVGTDKGYLCSARKTWFDVSAEIQQPDVIISALGRKRFHIYDNVEKFAITNNLFGLYWHENVSSSQKATVIEWLQSSGGQMSLANGASVEANGLLRLSPRAVGHMRVPFRAESNQMDQLTIDRIE